MNYIYDVLANFQSDYYDFFEWNKDDTVIRLRKIPIVKVNNKTYYNLKYNKVIVNEDFLNIIENKTEIFNDQGVGFLQYACVLAIDEECFIVKFNSNGQNIYKSSILIDEEMEILEEVQCVKQKGIEYIVCSEGKSIIMTRKEQKNIHKIINDINYLFEHGEYDKLNYLYYECFNMKNDNCVLVKDELIRSLNNSKVINKICGFIKLISKV